MRPLLQHASRSVWHNVGSLTQQQASRASFKTFTQKSSICWSCQVRASLPSQRWAHQWRRDENRAWFRQYSTEKETPKEEKPSPSPEVPEESQTTDADNTSSSAPVMPTLDSHTSKNPSATARVGEDPIIAPTILARSVPTDNIKRVPAEELPSHREKQRWDLSKRFSDLMDEVLPKLAVVTQKVNTYTGTDYSGIEALRREIKEQERLVKSRHQAIEESKQAFEAAHAQQAASQKEVVALLERKHSWSAADLERYMSLIRSEHINDRAVRDAKEAVGAAENALEEARSQLEKRERAQYHEEQIWSDTIRRNSTWVTFGLLGFNIFLLLVNLVIIEPWRRRRMVKEIKHAMEAQKPAVPSAAPAVAPVVAVATPRQTTEEIEAAIDQALEAEQEPAQAPNPEPEVIAAAPIVESVPVPPESAEPAPFIEPVESSSATPEASPEPAETVAQINIEAEKEVEPPKEWLDKVKAQCRDLVSEEPISMRKKDLANAVSTAAAVGFIVASVISMIVYRP